MAILRRDRNGILILGKQSAARADIPRNLENPRDQPRSAEVPSVLVRVKGASKPVALMNIPPIEPGVDLVLYMISAYPHVEALTSDLSYVRFGDIVSIEHPGCDATLIEEAKRSAPEALGANVWIPVRHGSRMERNKDGAIDDVPIRICNIPDSEGGRALLREIFERYGSRGIYEYTLYTSENGNAAIWSLAEANRHSR